MSLLINSQKVKEAIGINRPVHTVSASNIVVSNIEPKAEPDVLNVTTAVPETPSDLKEVRERVAALRRRAIQQGEKTLSFDGLERLIDDIRGRS